MKINYSGSETPTGIDTFLVSAFYVDFSHGSEPTTGINLLIESSKNFRRIVLVTSSNTKPETLSELERIFGDQLEIHVVKVSLSSKIDNSFFFYPLYRNWQKKVGKLLSSGKVEYDLGLHATLGTFLFGTGLCNGNKPYIYGPAGFSFFDLRYCRVVGIKSIKEILRNLGILTLLTLDPFVRKSLKKATVVIGSDKSVLKFLQLTRNGDSLYSLPVPHAIVPKYSYEDSPAVKERNRIIWVGRFISRKDPFFALEAFGHLLKANPSLKLTMVGEGRLEGKILDFIRQNSLEDKVDLTGWITKNEVMNLMRRSEFMFFTSFRESAGMQIFECVSVGTKVISLNATGASTWFQNPLVQFVGPRFGQSRKELMIDFCDTYEETVTLFNESKSDYAKSKDLDSTLIFVRKNLFERILKIFKEVDF